MKILVPLDFSSHSKSTLEYAAALATSLHGSIHLVHVITPLSGAKTFVTDQKDEVEKNVVYTLHDTQKQLKHEYGLSSHINVAIGTVWEEILKMANDKKADMIVMGTHGQSASKKILFGSNTSSVIDKATIPVLAVPRGSVFSPPKRIVFGTDYFSSEVNDLKGLAAFAGRFDAEIVVVHVVNRFLDYDEEDFDPGAVRNFSEFLKKKTHYSQLHCEEYQHTDVAEGISCFVREENADILALSVRHKSVIQKLFTRSLSKEILFQIEIPLLVFHDPTEPLQDDDF